jgi:hypothetical protein
MFKSQLKFGLFAVMIAAISVTGCKKDKELPQDEEEELITTLRLKFVNKALSTDVRTFTFKDIDGDGGKPPVIDDIKLAANAVYTLTVDAVLNESASPAEDIKKEIQEEADEHLFVYKPTTGLNLTITITDKDSKNLPIGLAAEAKTTAVSAGKLQVLLRHQPGSKNGTETPGGTDIDATFNVAIQ